MKRSSAERAADSLLAAGAARWKDSWPVTGADGAKMAEALAARIQTAQRENLVREVLQSMCGPGLADRMIRQTIARCGAESELAASDWAVFATVLASITARIGGAEAGRVILRASGCSPLENAA